MLAFLGIAELVALPAFGAFFSPVGRTTVAAVALADLGICGVGTLVGAMGAAGRARELLVPLLFLPLAIPVIVGGVGASVTGESRYLGFLALYDAIFCWSPGRPSSTWSPSSMTPCGRSAGISCPRSRR